MLGTQLAVNKHDQLFHSGLPTERTVDLATSARVEGAMNPVLPVDDAVNAVLLEVHRLRDTLERIASPGNDHHSLHNAVVVVGHYCSADDQLAQLASPRQYTRRDFTSTDANEHLRNETTAPVVAAIHALRDVAAHVAATPPNAHRVYVAYAATHALMVWAKSLYPNIDPEEASSTCVALMAEAARREMIEIVFRFGGQRVYERMRPLTVWIEDHTDDTGITLHNLLHCSDDDLLRVDKWLEVIARATELPVWD
jgi:hypothetical protein